MSIKNTISLVLLIVLIISYVGLKIVQKIHRKDPKYIEKHEEELRLERMQQLKNQEMEEYAIYSDLEYRDEME